MIPYRSDEITKEYNRINDLRNTNASDNKVTINYKKLDDRSASSLRAKVTQALNEYNANYREKMSDTTKKYIHKLQKSNSQPSITIEYDKFDNDIIATQFREAIQFVLIRRAKDIYLDMTLNHTI